MISLARGQKTKLADLTAALQLQVALRFNAPQLAFDFSCFGLDEEGKLSDDRYFIFYNQTESPEKALRLINSMPHEAQFALDLSRLPAAVNRLVFVATVDGTGAMSAIESGEFSLGDGKATVAQFALEGALFGTEKAIMVAEIYRKGEWRLAANGQGYAEGLNAVLKHFGGEAIEEAAPAQIPVAAPTPGPPKLVSLQKAGSSFKIDLNKSAGEIIATALWIDNGDNSSDNDDLDLRAGVLFPDGSMSFITCSNPGSLQQKPFVFHQGDIKEASLDSPGQETMKVNAQIGDRFGGNIALVFSIYSAVGNGMVSVASLKPKMKLQYGQQIVECQIDFLKEAKANQPDVYTYVIGLAVIKNGQIEISPGGQFSTPGSEATPWLQWDKLGGVQVTMDGPVVFKDDDVEFSASLNTGNKKQYI